jgi:hypothetical protein
VPKKRKPAEPVCSCLSNRWPDSFLKWQAVLTPKVAGGYIGRSPRVVRASITAHAFPAVEDETPGLCGPCREGQRSAEAPNT